jgi:hypothetical protein
MTTRFKVVMNFSNKFMDFDIILYDDIRLTSVRFVRRNINRTRNQYDMYVEIGRMFGLRGTKADRDFVSKYVDALKCIREWFKPLILNADNRANFNITPFRVFNGYLDTDNGTFTINDYILNTTVPLNSITVKRETKPNRKKAKRQYTYNFMEDLSKWKTQPL